jgi:leucine dehydrogenase
MSVFEHPDFDRHVEVAFSVEPAAGLRAIIALHRLGPLGVAGGGCRLWPYADSAAALRDALRLSRAMTYKLALFEIPVGGGKAVVVTDPARPKDEALLLAVGRAVERLGGRFVVGDDVGITPADLAVIARATRWVSPAAPTPEARGESTAYGVLVSMRAALRRRLGRAELAGVRVAVQGLGGVGLALCRQLAAAGARLQVASLDGHDVDTAVRMLGAVPVPRGAILDSDVDVFAPCALGDVLDERAVARLRCAVVAGSANNQLVTPSVADGLAARGILYAPDFVVNAGGAIAEAVGIGRDPKLVRQRIEAIVGVLETVFARAVRERVSTHVAAERLARERFAALGGVP